MQEGVNSVLQNRQGLVQCQHALQASNLLQDPVQGRSQSICVYNEILNMQIKSGNIFIVQLNSFVINEAMELNWSYLSLNSSTSSFIAVPNNMRDKCPIPSINPRFMRLETSKP